MLEREKASYKVVVPLDEFDAICDEFLKAFDVIDADSDGLINASDFSAYQRLLTGENVTHFCFTVARQCANRGQGPTVSDGEENIKFLGRLAPSVGLIQRANQDQEKGDERAFSGPANILFLQKKQQLLALSFEQIDVEGEGVIEAAQVLETIGLASAIDYIKSIFDPGTKITDAFWPCAAYILDDRETVDLELSENEGDFDEHLQHALSDFLPDHISLLCDLSCASA